MDNITCQHLHCPLPHRGHYGSLGSPLSGILPHPERLHHVPPKRWCRVDVLHVFVTGEQVIGHGMHAVRLVVRASVFLM